MSSPARPGELVVAGDDVGQDERRDRHHEQQPAQHEVRLPAAVGGDARGAGQDGERAHGGVPAREQRGAEQQASGHRDELVALSGAPSAAESSRSEQRRGEPPSGDRIGDRDELLAPPRPLAGEPQVQAVLLPRELLHRAQLGLRLLQRRRSDRRSGPAAAGAGRPRSPGGVRPAKSATRPGVPGREASRFHSTCTASGPAVTTSTQRASGSGTRRQRHRAPEVRVGRADPLEGLALHPPIVRRYGLGRCGFCSPCLPSSRSWAPPTSGRPGARTRRSACRTARTWPPAHPTARCCGRSATAPTAAAPRARSWRG